MDPLASWRGNDEEDRQGMTEIQHVTNYLKYYAELNRRHPDMFIDTCASGGRRLTLDTLRYAVPLWRSDYQYVCDMMPGLTYGISMWIPYYGGGNVESKPGPTRISLLNQAARVHRLVVAGRRPIPAVALNRRHTWSA